MRFGGGTRTTKEEFQDASFKMPKVMRDIIYKIVSRSPGLVHMFHISGFYIDDKVLPFLILDTSARFVSRYDAFSSVECPITESKIHSRTTGSLTIILRARIIMKIATTLWMMMN